MAIRFTSTFPTERGVETTVNIHDTEYVGEPVLFNTDGRGFGITYAETGGEQTQRFMSTACEVLFWIENETDFGIISDFSQAQEGRFFVSVYEGVVLKWAGVVLPDVTSYDEAYFPIAFKIKAVDGVGSLKDVPFKTADDEFYTGKATIIQFITRALSRISYVSEFYGPGDTFIRTAVDWWEETMVHDGLEKDALGQAYLGNAVYYTYKDGVQGVLSCYDVLNDILTSLGCRLTSFGGFFHLEQLPYRISDTIVLRRYDVDGAFIASLNYDLPNEIDQTAQGALLATGQYEFTAPISRAEHRFAALYRRNFFAGAQNVDESHTGIDTFNVPIHANSNQTTLRITGSLVMRISSNISEPGYTAPLNPMVAVIRVNFFLNSVGLQRTYTLLPTYQFVYATPTWSATPGCYILQPIGGIFLANTTDGVYTFSQGIDIVTPPLTENTDSFTVSWSLEALKYYDGTTVPDWSTDFNITWEITNLWMEAYSNGGPVLNGDGDLYYTPNPETSNTLVWKTEGMIGSSTNPNTVGAIWVKPGSDYELAGAWGVGEETPAFDFVGQMLTRDIARTHAKPARKLNGTLYGDILSLSRVVWQEENWILLGGTWNAANSLLSGTWMEMKEVEGLVPSDPIPFGEMPHPSPPRENTNHPGGLGPFLVGAPPGSVWNAVASTLSADPIRGNTTPGSINIQDVLSDYDFNAGDQIAIIHPLSGAFETLGITSTTTNGQTALDVLVLDDSGVLLNDYPIGSPIVRIPRIGGPFSLPGGVAGQIMRHNGTRWEAYGTTAIADGWVLTWTDAGGWAAAAPSGGLSDGDKGDITVSGSGSVWTIDNAAVTLSKMANMATASFLGRNTAGAGSPEVLSIATAKTMLGLSGTNSGDQTITLTGDVTGSGTGSFAATIGNNAVTVAKIQALAGLSVLARTVNSTGNMAALTASVALTYLRLNAAGTSLEWGALPTIPTVSGTAGQVAVFTGSSTVGSFVTYLYDSTNGRVQINTSGTPVAPTARYDVRAGIVTGDDEVFRYSGTVSGTVFAYLANNRNVSGTGFSCFVIQVGGTSAGDPILQFVVLSGETWTMGADNSDADKFKIRPQTSLSAGATGGEGITITSDVTPLVGINTDTPAHPHDVNGIARALTFTNRTDANSATWTFGTGAGGSPTMTSLIYQTGNAGTVRFTTGTSPTAGAVIVNMVPPTAVRHANKVYVTFSPMNAATASEITKFYIDPTATTAGNIALRANGSLTAATEYYLSFHVFGHA